MASEETHHMDERLVQMESELGRSRQALESKEDQLKEVQAVRAAGDLVESLTEQLSQRDDVQMQQLQSQYEEQRNSSRTQLAQLQEKDVSADSLRKERDDAMERFFVLVAEILEVSEQKILQWKRSRLLESI